MRSKKKSVIVLKIQIKNLSSDTNSVKPLQIREYAIAEKLKEPIRKKYAMNG